MPPGAVARGFVDVADQRMNSRKRRGRIQIIKKCLDHFYIGGCLIE